MGSEPATTDDPAGGPTTAHWAVVLFVIGHFVTLLLLTVCCVVAMFEIELSGGWSAKSVRGSLFAWLSTWSLLLFGVYPLPSLAFWRPFLRASVSWLDILRGRRRRLSEADRGRGWLYSAWGPAILIANCAVPIVVAVWGLLWFER
ncbi:MAG: hypothetical protein VB861_20030 [Planctomycetaceae bacterium]